MPLSYARVVTAPDGRTWTVEREVLPTRERPRRPFPHEINPDRVWAWSTAYWIAPSVVVVVLLARSVVVPALVALLLAGAGWVGALNGLHRRMRGRAAWKIVASCSPTESELGRQLAWAVVGLESSERAVDDCADSIHRGTVPDDLNPGPPLSA